MKKVLAFTGLWALKKLEYLRTLVTKHGNVSDVHALNMQGTKLAEITVNCIRKGPKWNPAIQNGTKVNAYRRQPVTLVNPGL